MLTYQLKLGRAALHEPILRKIRRWRGLWQERILDGHCGRDALIEVGKDPDTFALKVVTYHRGHLKAEMRCNFHSTLSTTGRAVYDRHLE